MACSKRCHSSYKHRDKNPLDTSLALLRSHPNDKAFHPLFIVARELHHAAQASQTPRASTGRRRLD